MAYFPMFVNISDSVCLVVGGGEVALRKVYVLRDFGARVHIVAVKVNEAIKSFAENDSKVFFDERALIDSDLEGVAMVIAATDNKELNKKISLKCKELKIPINAVDQKEYCSFIFPSYHKEGSVVAAYSSSGKSPIITQYLKERSREYLDSFIGELTEYLGDIREYIKENVKDEQKRKAVFKSIFEEALTTGKIPDSEIIEKYIKGA